VKLTLDVLARDLSQGVPALPPDELIESDGPVGRAREKPIYHVPLR
jgi:hypothetical protein